VDVSVQSKVKYRTAAEGKHNSRMQKVGPVLWVGAPNVPRSQID
jgi:hypothetical protein